MISLIHPYIDSPIDLTFYILLAKYRDEVSLQVKKKKASATNAWIDFTSERIVSINNPCTGADMHALAQDLPEQYLKIWKWPSVISEGILLQFCRFVLMSEPKIRDLRLGYYGDEQMSLHPSAR